jgi:hypothetical protein
MLERNLPPIENSVCTSPKGSFRALLTQISLDRNYIYLNTFYLPRGLLGKN